jgi:hypothetical protein
MIQVPNWSLWSALFVYAIKQIFHFLPHNPYSSGTGHMNQSWQMKNIIRPNFLGDELE